MSNELKIEEWYPRMPGPHKAPEGFVQTGSKQIFVNKGGSGTNMGYVTVPLYTKQSPVAAAPAPAPAPAPTPKPTVAPQDPVPLVPLQIGAGTGSGAPMGTDYSSQIADLLKQITEAQSKPVEMPDIKLDIPGFSVANSTAITNNATGFTRKQSTARKAGLTSRGTARLRINRSGQTTASSGLNIGI